MREIHVLQGNADASYGIALHFTADGSYLISAGMKGHLHVWSAQDWSHTRQIPGHAKSVNTLAMNRDGTRMATGSSDCRVCIWSFPACVLLHRLQDRKQVVAGMDVTHGGDAFAVCSYGGRVAAWNFEGEQLAGFKASHRNLGTVAFSPEDTVILTGGLGGQLSQWSYPEGRLQARIDVHETALGYVHYVPGTGQVMTLGYDGLLKLWDPATWGLLRTVSLHDARITGFRFDFARQRLLVLSQGLVRLFDLAHWTYVDELAIQANVLPCCAFAPDGRTAAVASADGKVRILELA